MFKKITFERTMCYGTCPVYKVDIFENGIVNWEGVDFVSKLGQHHWKLSYKKIEKLNNLIDQFDFRNYENSTIIGSATDHSSIIISIEFMDGFVKEIDHYLGDRYEEEVLVDYDKIKISDFENIIESIIGTKKYVKELLYIFHIKHKYSINLEGYYNEHVVVASNEESALSIMPLGAESLDNSGNYFLNKEDWDVSKIGKDNTENLYPYVVMSCK